MKNPFRNTNYKQLIRSLSVVGAAITVASLVSHEASAFKFDDAATAALDPVKAAITAHGPTVIGVSSLAGLAFTPGDLRQRAVGAFGGCVLSFVIYLGIKAGTGI